MSNYQYIQPAIAQFQAIPAEAEAPRIGCSAEEIAAMQATLPSGYQLPAAYLEFLSHAGKQWGRLFGSHSMGYAQIFTMAKDRFSDYAEQVFVEDDEPAFPSEIFLIEEGNGSHFSFFKLDEGADPPVYQWKEKMEDFSEAVQIFPHYSLYLAAMVAEHAGVFEPPHQR